MKKLLTMLLALAMVFSLAACGDKPESKGETKQPAAQKPSKELQVKEMTVEASDLEELQSLLSGQK